jgi:glycosyltransferase involved in cell wall biosynthesis
MRPAILFLIDVLPAPGGTEMHLFELSRRLNVAGYHAIVCNMDGEHPMTRRVADAGVETWPRRIGRIYAPSGRAIAREIIGRAAGRNIVAVHTFHFKSDWMGVSAARALKCPLISSRRDLGYQQNGLRRTLYRWINRRTNAFIVPSEAVENSVLRQGGVTVDRVHRIYNGLDLKRFADLPDRREARAWLGVPEDALLIGKVGSLRTIKDHPTLIRAVARLVPEFPRVHLVLMGDGPEEEALRALVEQLGIAAHVTLAGVCRDVPRALAALDIFALSSRSEGMSNAILEAMAAGLPVVATDVGGNPECVVDGATGYIVPPGDDERMADRLVLLVGRR